MSVRTEVLMGTLVTIRADARHAEDAIERAFGWFREIESRCTRFNPHSELMQLTTRIGVPIPVSPIVFEAVRFAISVAQDTGGAFDPAIGHRMEARGFNREDRTGRVVHTGIAAPADVSFRDVHVDDDAQTITLGRPLVLDLGAVAKGLAIDAAARELQPLGDFVIDAGGDLYLAGSSPRGSEWLVGVRHPRSPGELIHSMCVSNQAVCTSGDYERVVAAPDPIRRTPENIAVSAEAVFAGRGADSDQATEHHILNPRSGTSPSAVASATVVAPSAMLADALATAAFVLGPVEGIRLLERHGVDGLIVTPTLERFQTPGLPTA
jgi:thiamine biosynthesis lipoprotein